MSEYPPEDPAITDARLERFEDEHREIVRSTVSVNETEIESREAFVDAITAEVEALDDHPSDHCRDAMVEFTETDHAHYGYLHATIHAALADDSPRQWLAAQVRRIANTYDVGQGGNG